MSNVSDFHIAIADKMGEGSEAVYKVTIKYQDVDESLEAVYDVPCKTFICTVDADPPRILRTVLSNAQYLLKDHLRSGEILLVDVSFRQTAFAGKLVASDR